VHDFSALGWSGNEICVVCHTPHDADVAAIELAGPLWNHEVTTATFTLYSSPTLYATPVQPMGPSKLCLSCHDGSVAIDSFGGATGETFVAGDALIGTDLSDDHPISIAWEHQTQQGSCFNCHAVHGGSGGPTFVSPPPFFEGRVECSSCHDVHDSAGFDNLLWISNAGSALCLHCHGK
jgi:predicted CXXCH cytochrome family protein